MPYARRRYFDVVYFWFKLRFKDLLYYFQNKLTLHWSDILCSVHMTCLNQQPIYITSYGSMHAAMLFPRFQILCFLESISQSQNVNSCYANAFRFTYPYLSIFQNSREPARRQILVNDFIVAFSNLFFWIEFRGERVKIRN